MSAALVLLLKRIIIARIKTAMFKKLLAKLLESKTFKGSLTVGSALPLLIGAISGAFGSDLAPTEVDMIVSFVAFVGVVIGRWRAAHQAAQ